MQINTNQKREQESLNSPFPALGVSKDQDIIQVNNSMQTPGMEKKQYGFGEHG